jgi:hypothetical protein
VIDWPSTTSEIAYDVYLFCQALLVAVIL